MSINNASKFIAKVYERDEAVLTLLPKGVSPDNIGADEIAAIAAAAKNADWDFTADELQEAYLDSMMLDEGELSAVAGGAGPDPTKITGYSAKGPGGCSSNYYAEHCRATWETGSNCTCDDYKTGEGTRV